MEWTNPMEQSAWEADNISTRQENLTLQHLMFHFMFKTARQISLS
jgi:hypothetical protein